MNFNKLTIKISKPANLVFGFTIDPKNSPLWVPGFVFEETSQWPVKLGTIYKNKNEAGEWHEYMVSAYEKNKLFKLTSSDGNYHVHYTFTPVNEKTTELEYFEWVDKGDLDEPFGIEPLEKLKALLENN